MNIYLNRITQRIISFAGNLQYRLNAFRLSFVKYVISFFIPKKPTPQIKDATESYIDKQMQRFLHLSTDKSSRFISGKATLPMSEGVKTENQSENINATFYNRKDFNELMETPNNDLEREWQSRILIESTPRGTIIMLYDVYKEGFAYYSDLTGMQYKLLNAVAAKFSTIFRCRDFFIDELALPNNPSPFLKQIHDEQTQEQDKKRSTMANTIVDTASKTNPFVKFKQPVNQSTKLTDVINKVTNKFMYRGKVHNFHPLQPPKPPQLPTTTTTSFDKWFSLESDAQTNLMSYKNFKTKKN